ncbi:PAS domain S-box protein [Microvirga antarctica]|uniref:PAS domain S-box protein n=1 Tax=Microvirga antarctica TaxID=2819233 RepID=UPI001B303FE3|nr:PAS domain S-box protein [Microvirga antarctica]
MADLSESLPVTSDMRARVEAHDWESTPLGPRSRWPQSLRTLVGVMLGSRQPMFLAWGPERVMIYNDGYAPMLGQRHPSALGRRFADVWFDILTDVEPIMDRAYAGISTHMDDLMLMTHRNGYAEEAHFAFSYTPVRDDDGTILGMFCACTETTEKFLAEKLIRDKETEYRQILDSATEYAIIALDRDGRVSHWNAGAQRVLGWSEEEMLGQTIHRCFTPDDVAAGRVETEMKRASEEGSDGDEGWRVRKDGSRFWASGQMTPLRSASGALMGYVKVLRDRTAQRLSEAALAASEERLRIAQQAGGVGTFEWDPATGLVTMSEEFRRLWGLTADVIPLEVLGQMVDAADRDNVGSLRGAVNADSLAYTEYRITRPDNGEIRWIARRGEVMRDADGNLTRGFGVVYDITQRKLIEDALRESEAKFRTFSQVMPNHVWAADSDGSLDWFNEQVYAYSGRAPGELDGDKWAALLHPADVAAAAALWQVSVATGRFYQTEFRIRGADGTYRWHLSRALPIMDTAGNALRWIGTNTDIEVQKAAVEDLARLNATLEEQIAQRTQERDRVWRVSREVIVVSNREGVYQSVNPAFERTLGWTSEEATSRPFISLVHDDDVAATLAEFERLNQGRETSHFECRFRHRDGSYRWLQWTAVPDEQLIYAVGRDVTAEKEQARILSETEEALRQSQKMEAVGQLTGGIAHDFNNLLTGILGSIEMMQNRIRQGRTGELERYATAASGAANRAAALTHRLLAFSRRQPLDPKAVDANALIDSMEDLLRRTSGEAIDIRVVPAPNLWPTLCDPHQLENAILNLAINARDAMPDGGVLTLETANVDIRSAHAARITEAEPGAYVCVSISDSGTGMAKEVIAKAFDPFFTTKPLGEGTGLGLSMVYGFARQSEGFVRIYSQVGHGTTVKLFLPRHLGEAVTEPVGLSADDVQRGAGETVLVVEDEPTVRELVCEILRDLGYLVLQANDGPSGLRLFESSVEIDLLVTDVGLPGLNGRQLADAARTHRPDLKVLFMTGYAENAATASGFLDPGMAMITKPFAVDALATRIREILAAEA